MNELMKNLEGYGADIKGVMDRFLDDTELYQTCLEIFMGDEGFEELGQTLKQKSYEEAFDHAHTLKGVAGNLGLTPLFQAISEVVEQLRREEYEAVEEQYKIVLKEKTVVQSMVG